MTSAKVTIDAGSFRRLLSMKTRYEKALQQIELEWEMHHDSRPHTAFMFYEIAHGAVRPSNAVLRAEKRAAVDTTRIADPFDDRNRCD